MIMNRAMIILLFMVTGSQPCPSVKAWHGRFIVYGTMTGCSLLMNGVPLQVQKLQEVRAYGLLQVECPECSFSVVSNFQSCDDCFICEHDEGIEGCRSIFWPVDFGVTLSLLTILVFVILYMLVPKAKVDAVIHSIVDSFSNARTDAKKKKKQRRAKHFMEAIELGMLTPPFQPNPAPVPAPRPERSRRMIRPIYPDLTNEPANQNLINESEHQQNDIQSPSKRREH